MKEPRYSLEILLKIGVPIITILLAVNGYFVKGLADSVSDIPVLKEQVRSIQSQMPNMLELRVDVGTLKNSVNELREDLKRGIK